MEKKVTELIEESALANERGELQLVSFLTDYIGYCKHISLINYFMKEKI